MSLTIETKRLRLIAGTPEIAQSAIENSSLFSALLNAYIPNEWPPELLRDAEQFFADMIAKNPDEIGWWGWYVILKGDSDLSQDVLIGSAGFKGPPNAQGTVEMGYSLLEAYQGNGFATEAARALTNWALDMPGANRVTAETFPTLPLSIRVMEKCGMQFVGKGSEEGTIQYAIEK